ncbi:MAG TPA: methylated-DNA--[protein]-cysteine S-methyltransferase [Bacillota bacterium]
MIVRVPSRLGVIPFEFEGERLLRVWLPNSAEAAPGGLVIDGDTVSGGLPAWVAALARDIQDYARGRDIDLNPWAQRVDLSGQPPFYRRVYEALLQVRRGETRTYGELAAAAGSPGAARAVGSAMAANDVPLVIPCHRVVATGGLGGYGGGLDLKRRLLALEGALHG